MAKKQVNMLEECHHISLLQNTRRYSNTEKVEKKHTNLQRDVFFMQKATDADYPIISPSKAPSPLTKAVQKPVVPLPTGRYARFLEEKEEQERIGIRRSQLINDRLDAQLEPIQANIEELKVLHTDLKLHLGIQHDEDIAMLYKNKPQPATPRYKPYDSE